MSNSVLSKSETTRRLNLLAGVRPPLPGHSNFREQELRRSICECFEPVNAIEMLLVNDIAYVSATIEVLRAQMSGFMVRVLRENHRRLSFSAPSAFSDPFGDDDDASLRCFADTSNVLTDGERAQLEVLEADGFGMRPGKGTLEVTSFAILLGNMNMRELRDRQMLQQLLHAETRERDRLVNQLDKRRRQAMRDAIEWADAERRAREAEASAAKKLEGSPIDDSEATSQTKAGKVSDE